MSSDEITPEQAARQSALEMLKHTCILAAMAEQVRAQQPSFQVYQQKLMELNLDAAGRPLADSMRWAADHLRQAADVVDRISVETDD